MVSVLSVVAAVVHITNLNGYWAYPDDYTHIAMRAARRMDILWMGRKSKFTTV